MPDLFWIEHEWRGNIRLEVTDRSPLPLDDPAALRRLVRPRFSLPQMVVLFAGALLSRVLRRETRNRVLRLLGRSYA
jgi:hypothetical protein